MAFATFALIGRLRTLIEPPAKHLFSLLQLGILQLSFLIPSRKASSVLSTGQRLRANIINLKTTAFAHSGAAIALAGVSSAKVVFEGI